MITLRQKVDNLRRRYKYVTNNRFLYVSKSDLKKKSAKITAYLIVDSKKKGVFIFVFPFVRKTVMSVDQWSKLWTKPLKGYKSLYSILTEDVLPNISIRYHDDWKFIDLIGWTIHGVFGSIHKPMAKRLKTKRKQNSDKRLLHRRR